MGWRNRLRQGLSNPLRALLPLLFTIGLGLALLAPLPLRAGSPELPATTAATASIDRSAAAGSYDVAPVRILGVPAISVAAPVVSRAEQAPDARQRATVIEGNLSLLYEAHGLCTTGELVAESLLEGLILGGPEIQRLCSGNPWAVLGRPNDLSVELSADGSQLQARLAGRATPLPLLTVTEADAQLHGLERAALAERWRQILQRRLRHARLTEQPEQIALRLKITLLLELLLAASFLVTLRCWSGLRGRLKRGWEAAQAGGVPTVRAQLLQWIVRALFVLALAQLVGMAGLAVAAVPGRVPLAITLLLQPIAILSKVLLLGICALALRLLAHFVLRQWVSNLAVPAAERARRQQRYRNLRQASQRLIDLGCIAVLVVLVLADVPGVRELTLGAWLAGGALLGGLAIAFQGLLRDGVAGLAALLDDHYAVGDVVEVQGVQGEVVDVGLLVTELRTADQRVVLFANSAPQQLVNHTKIRSGIELLIPLAGKNQDLERALAVVAAECEAFAADPHWSPQLLAPPWQRGVKRVTAEAIELSVVLTTHTGQQWAAQRALLQRLLVTLQQNGIPLACEAPSYGA